MLLELEFMITIKIKFSRGFNFQVQESGRVSDHLLQVEEQGWSQEGSCKAGVLQGSCRISRNYKTGHESFQTPPSCRNVCYLFLADIPYLEYKIIYGALAPVQLHDVKVCKYPVLQQLVEILRDNKSFRRPVTLSAWNGFLAELFWVSDINSISPPCPLRS